jgi:hypothetical protein
MSKQTLIASLKNLDDDTDIEEGNFFHPHFMCGVLQAPYLDAFPVFRDQVRTAAREGAPKVHLSTYRLFVFQTMALENIHDR